MNLIIRFYFDVSNLIKMAIYAKPVRLLMREMVSDFGLKDNQSFVREEAVDWFLQHYPKIKKGTVTAHLIRLSVNARSRFHYRPKPREDDLLFQIDSNHFRLYDTSQDPLPIHAVGNSEALKKVQEFEEDTEFGVSTEFAYESDLRDYLARNLQVNEPGFSLYDEEGIIGVEFPVGGRFIDILGVDSNGDFVVVELKVSRGYDRVIGQLLRYMAWIQKNQADLGQKVRGVIVAREISQDLILACSLIPNVELFEYKLSLSLKQIHPASEGT